MRNQACSRQTPFKVAVGSGSFENQGMFGRRFLQQPANSTVSEPYAIPTLISTRFTPSVSVQFNKRSVIRSLLGTMYSL